MKSDLNEAGYQLTSADWFKATRNNEVSALKKFVASGFDVLTKNETGDSALHTAASHGAKDAANFLLSKGIPVDVRGAAGRTPLMSAVDTNQTAMVRWLIRQEADVHAKDNEGFSPLMLAVREGNAGPVEELATYSREDLDSALLLAALLGKTEVIDALTNFGASVYARMEDGRTPLIVAAENGHTESVKLLLDIGAGRFSTDTNGRTAADAATTAGHPEIAALINNETTTAELTLESPAEITKSMDAMVDAASADSPTHEFADNDTERTASASPNSNSKPNRQPSISQSIQGATLSSAITAAASQNPESQRTQPVQQGNAKSETANNPVFAAPPLVMRFYREREMPIQVTTIVGDAVTLTINGKIKHDVNVRPGETIPGSRLIVLRAQRRMKDSKLNLGIPMEVSVVEVRDTATGATREWISGVPTTAHDPVAIVEDAATGKRYLARPGEKFKSADGTEFIISDVRPNQIVIENASSGAVQTLPLRGPRG
ncbi:MAG: ankyrin repeat domain-containing protein [Gloeobacteraceae cyanobacterium ES-bin-144]|nr:ankyrin repeat domain-containing protein [Verrucomicrobiales bacterium]